jgi:hypothetical protein
VTTPLFVTEQTSDPTGRRTDEHERASRWAFVVPVLLLVGLGAYYADHRTGDDRGPAAAKRPTAFSQGVDIRIQTCGPTTGGPVVLRVRNDNDALAEVIVDVGLYDGDDVQISTVIASQSVPARRSAELTTSSSDYELGTRCEIVKTLVRQR